MRVITERWLHEEERWDDEEPSLDTDEDLLTRGYAPWEVRVDCGSLRRARELADQLEHEGYSVTRTFNYVIAGTETREQAQELARRVRGDVEPGGELVYEVLPRNPFAVIGTIAGGGTGTPF